MEQIFVLDSNFESFAVIDVFESLIWTIRYQEAGDFELYTPVTKELLEILKIDTYLYNERFFDAVNNEAHLMIIETIEIDNEHLKVSGRSLKSILDRRIIWGQKKFDEDSLISTAITDLITDNIINPTEYTNLRKISNFVLESVPQSITKKFKEDTQFYGESLLSIMDDFCTKYKLGYEVVYNFTQNKFVMRIITPVDHSLDQTTTPPVVFSEDYDNLKNSNFIESVKTYKNLAFVAGEKYQQDDVQKFHQTAVIGDETVSGLARRELFVDASSVSHTDEKTTMSTGAYAEYDSGTYANMLKDKGTKALKKEENKYKKVYDGVVDPATDSYVFGTDYKIGDVIEIINKYGIESKSRVIEIVFSVSTSGVTAIPTFEAIKDEEDDE